MATGDTFPAEEFGSGRLTPLVDAPTWLKTQPRREDEDRATLTPYDRAFLESPPTYEEGGSLSESLQPPPTRPAPSALRRALSLLLFVAIAGSASAVLAMAVLRLLGRALPFSG